MAKQYTVAKPSYTASQPQLLISEPSHSLRLFWITLFI